MNSITTTAFLTLVSISVIVKAQNPCQKSLQKTIQNFSEQRFRDAVAPEFKSYFISRDQPPRSIDDYIRSLNDWDLPLHAEFEIIEMETNADTIRVFVNEQNDFSKGIGYPGWKATLFFRVNSDCKIVEQLYVPDPANKNYGEWFEPAVEWLKKNRLSELTKVYDLDKGKLIRTPEAARQWPRLLKAWSKSNRVKKH